MWKDKHYWIVGASAGLGREIALQLSEKGAKLTLLARNEADLQTLSAELYNDSNIAVCDVSNNDSVSTAFEKTINFAALDGLIFCAGEYSPMTAQNWNYDQAERICDVNFTGCARVIGRTLPHLINNDTGHIVLIGSLSGLKGIPNGSAYGASKAGMIHLAEGLRADLSLDKFKVQIINPGFIKTRLTDKNQFKMPFIMSVEEAADRTIQAMESKKFRTNYPTRFSIFFKALSLLPDPLYFPVVQKIMRK